MVVTLLTSCIALASATKTDASSKLSAFESRRLDSSSLGLPPMTEGWSLSQWFRAAQAHSPALAEISARHQLIQAGEITAAQRPNPTMNLSTEYIAAAAGMPAWLYGMALDFLVQTLGTRDRAKATALLQTEAASANLADALWQLRMNLRNALLETVAIAAETRLLESLIAQREALLAAARRRAELGESAAAEVMRAELDLAAANQRHRQAQQSALAARQRLATVVGVPSAAVAESPLRWLDWDRPDQLTAPVSNADREAGLLARPELLRALRETDLAELGLQTELARRWPDMHVSPGYTWDHGTRKNQLGVGLPVPLFNHNEGPIAEAQARRELAARHMEAVQATLVAQMESAEQLWPAALANWQAALTNQERLARLAATERTLFAAGASDRPSLLAAATAVTEAALATQNSALAAQRAFGALEDAYRTPLAGPEVAAGNALTETPR
jgi:outer membrane protein TolC